MARVRKILYLVVPPEEFDQLKAGYKKEVYRATNNHWHNRIHGRHYDMLAISSGNRNGRGDDRRIFIPYEGFEIKEVSDPRLDNEPVRMFAIRVNVPQKDQKQ